MARSNYNSDEAVIKDLDVGQLKRLIQYLKPYRKQLWLTIALMFAATIIDSVSPYIVQLSIDQFIPNRQIGLLIAVALVYALAVVFSYIFTRLKIKLANRTGQYVLFDLRRDLFDHVQSLSLNFLITLQPEELWCGLLTMLIP